MAQIKDGLYSNNSARISGDLSFTAWDAGATGDSVRGLAEFKTRMVRSGGSSSTGCRPKIFRSIRGRGRDHESLLPWGHQRPLAARADDPKRRRVWAVGELYHNGRLVTDSAMVHVMLLSRTRGKDFKLECYTCARNAVEELQLQITPAEGQPKLFAPGGALFVNWEKSTSEGEAQEGARVLSRSDPGGE